MFNYIVIIINVEIFQIFHSPITKAQNIYNKYKNASVISVVSGVPLFKFD